MLRPVKLPARSRRHGLSGRHGLRRCCRYIVSLCRGRVVAMPGTNARELPVTWGFALVGATLAGIRPARLARRRRRWDAWL